MAWQYWRTDTATALGYLAKILTPEGGLAGVGETVALIVEVKDRIISFGGASFNCLSCCCWRVSYWWTDVWNWWSRHACSFCVIYSDPDTHIPLCSLLLVPPIPIYMASETRRYCSSSSSSSSEWWGSGERIGDSSLYSTPHNRVRRNGWGRGCSGGWWWCTFLFHYNASPVEHNDRG